MNWINEVLKFGATQIFQVEEVEEAEKSVRLAICEGCEHFQDQSRQCGICKCFMDVKTGTKVHRNVTKMRYEVTHCPVGKWMDLDVANEYRVIDGKEAIIQ